MRNIRKENGFSVSETKSGKYLMVMVKVRDNKIEQLIINGDFFAFPEDAIDFLENIAKGMTLEEVLKYIDELEVYLVGISKEDLKSAIKEAFERA